VLIPALNKLILVEILSSASYQEMAQTFVIY